MEGSQKLGMCCLQAGSPFPRGTKMMKEFSSELLETLLQKDEGELIGYLNRSTMFDAGVVGMLIAIAKQAIADELAMRVNRVPEPFVFRDDGNTSDRYASQPDERDYHEFSLSPITSELPKQVAEAYAEGHADPVEIAAAAQTAPPPKVEATYDPDFPF